MGTQRGTCAWNSSRAQNRWLKPANTIAPARARRATVRARVVGGGGGGSDIGGWEMVGWGTGGWDMGG
ncbi:putative uncharacterized protein [Mycobacterium sp. PO2]|nr:putative uncharacterized protein [Mycobacterium sp. PO2]